jgi:hypothetical protein
VGDADADPVVVQVQGDRVETGGGGGAEPI